MRHNATSATTWRYYTHAVRDSADVVAGMDGMLGQARCSRLYVARVQLAHYMRSSVGLGEGIVRRSTNVGIR